MAKRNTLEHPKNKRLARTLDTIPGITLGLLESIWHWTAKFKPQGLLTKLDLDDALRDAGWLSLWTTDQVLDALVNPEHRWLEKVDKDYYVHDWHLHADDWIQQHVLRNFETFALGHAPKRRIPNAMREAIEEAKLESQSQQSQQSDSVRQCQTKTGNVSLPKSPPMPKSSRKNTSPAKQGFKAESGFQSQSSENPDGTSKDDRRNVTREGLQRIGYNVDELC